MAGWADAFTTWIRNGQTIYCYFDNDQCGYAVQDALRLQAMFSHADQPAGIDEKRRNQLL
ncbi:MAG: DUF72 domain-containing protein [Gammaproteobacteria bacterium]|nr:DUF72 domain-containing protein [Gammaproteobacteria bacterium]